MSDPRIYAETFEYDDSVDDTEGRRPRPPGYLPGGPHYDFPDRLRPPEYPFGHASRPNWQPGYVPSATEWQSWFSRKLDTDDATLAGGPFLQIGGGQLHGPLLLARPPRLANEAATKAYVDNLTPEAQHNLLNNGGTINGDLRVLGDLHAECDLLVRRDTKLGQTLYVQGYSMLAGNLDVNADVTVTSTLYIGPLGAQGYGSACPPGDDEAALRQAMWGLWVDPTAGDRITSYTNNAYDIWRQATGMREWWAPGQTTALMTLDAQGNLTVLGQINSAGAGGGGTTNTVINNGLVVNPATGQQDAALFNGGIQVNGDIAYSGLLRAAPGITTGITTADSLTIQATPGALDALLVDGDCQFNSNLSNFTGSVNVGNQLLVGPSGSQFGLYMDGATGNRILNWAPNWYDYWQASSGSRSWSGPSLTEMILDASGNLSISGVLTQGSDVRRKRDIAPATVGLEQILKLQPRTFHRAGSRELGLIAQEVREVLPEAVAGDEDKLGITMLPLLAALIAAVQELDHKIEALAR